MRVGITTFLVVVLICLLAIVSPVMLAIVLATFGIVTLCVARLRDEAYRPSCTQCSWRGRPCATRRAAEMLALVHVCDTASTPFGPIDEPVVAGSPATTPTRGRRGLIRSSLRRTA